jgi:hypothetical protein
MTAAAALAVLASSLLVAQSPGGPGSHGDEAAYGLESRAALGAHHICAGLWVVGRGTKRSAEDILAEDIAPFKDFSWDKRFNFSVDTDRHTVTVSGPGIAARTAKYNGDQGCAILPRGETGIHFKPVPVTSHLPDAAAQPWPAGDRDAATPLPQGVDMAAINAALDWGMARRDQNTRAIVAVYRGKIIGERYEPGWTGDTPHGGARRHSDTARRSKRRRPGTGEGVER